MKARVPYIVALFVALTPHSLFGSTDTIGPNGINSGVLGLTGEGIAIGQVEGGRPGLIGLDTAAMCCNEDVMPTRVFVLDRNATENEADDGDHALWVASVMISKQTAVEPEPEDRSPPVGVAMEADLYSGALVVEPLTDLQANAAVTAQHIATFPNADVQAINMSFLVPEGDDSLDGNSTLTQFVDWSAGQHDVLYVIAGNDGRADHVPTDEFNGLTVAMSEKATDGVFRRVSTLNDFEEDADAIGPRTSTDILAPGNLIDVAGADGGQPARGLSTGTSIAAPHVTGTVALLQQHAKEQIDNGVTGWDADARRHQVMKAVLMNSADKIKDDGAIAPIGRFLGMERTVLASTTDNTWLNSPAFTDDNIPLDKEMGTGHLNANRAHIQLDAGESVPADFADATVNVPLIGWDYSQGGFSEFNKYALQGNLPAGQYVSATLVWDRLLVLDSDWDGDGEYDAADGTNPEDTFVTIGFDNLDLHIVPAGTMSLETATWKASSTAGPDESSVEHIFAPVPTAGQYEIWVENSNFTFGAGAYALAWWAIAPPIPVLGDYDRNGSVGPEDYTIWKQNFGSVSKLAADGNKDGVVDAADYTIWRDNFNGGNGSIAAVPEPSGLLLLLLGSVLFGWRCSP